MVDLILAGVEMVALVMMILAGGLSGSVLIGLIPVLFEKEGS